MGESSMRHTGRSPPSSPSSPRTADDLVWLIAGPVLLSLGTVGNLVSLAVMCRRSLRATTTGLLLSILAIVDLLNLWTALLRHWLTTAFNVNIREVSDASCKIHLFVVYFAVHLEAWILVIITLERFVAVYFPHRSHVLFSRTRAVIAVCVTSGLLVGANLHFFWTTRLRDTGGWRGCVFHSFFSRAWGWIDIFLANLAPFAVMLSLNAAIVHKLSALRKLRSFHEDHQGQQGQQGHQGEEYVNGRGLGVRRLMQYVSKQKSFGKSETPPRNVHTAAKGRRFESQGEDHSGQRATDTTEGHIDESGITNVIIISPKTSKSDRTQVTTIEPARGEGHLRVRQFLASEGHGQGHRRTAWGTHKQQDHREARLTVLLITVTFFFFVTTLPLCVYLIVNNSMYLGATDPEVIRQLDLAFAICSVLGYTNNAFNFLFYCLGGRRFRAELVSMCACSPRNCIHNGRVAARPETHATDDT